ncbi:MAG: hypothetical protein ACREON_02430 [Gemmatimonadaceae bacterium]
MNRFINAAVIAVSFVHAWPSSLQTQQSKASPATTSPRISACSLLPKAEVKKHLPWGALVDQMEPEEEPVGTAGSSCNYPSVFIQVLPAFRISNAQQKGEYETINGIGDEALFRNNRDRYAELFVRTGKYALTLQANANPSIEAVKAGVLNLARALVAKLP